MITEWLTGVKRCCLETILLIYHKKIHLCSSSHDHGQEINARSGNKGEVITSIPDKQLKTKNVTFNAQAIGPSGLFECGQICTPLWKIITKFPYNTRLDWLKQRVLSENSGWVDDMKLAFKFLLRNFDKFDPIYTDVIRPVHDSEKMLCKRAICQQ